eukprot:COSAG02_NODE_5516_length_4266_cov_11.146148_1_plen_65_part_10
MKESTAAAELNQSYVQYKMQLDKIRRQIVVIDPDMLSQKHYVRHFINGLHSSLKREMRMWDNYDE